MVIVKDGNAMLYAAVNVSFNKNGGYGTMSSTKTPYEPYTLPECRIEVPAGCQLKGVWKVEQLDEADGTDENAVELVLGTEITPEKKYLRINALWISDWALLQQEINAAENGATVTPTKDLIASSDDGPITVPLRSNITIDLNGHTVNRALTDELTHGHVFYLETAFDVTIKNGVITGGNSYMGGGIFVHQDTLRLSNVTVTGNHAEAGGAAISMAGGALYLDSCDLTGNAADAGTNGVHTYSYTVYLGEVLEESKVTISGTLKMDEIEIGDRVVLRVAGPLNHSVIPVTMTTFPGGMEETAITSGLSGKGTAGNFISTNPAYVIVTNSDGEAVITSAANLSFGTPDFTLPSAVSAVEAEAFDSAAMSIVYIPDGCVSIGDHAFRNCAGLEQIRIPAGCSLGEGVFDGCGAVYVFAPKGSPAEAYCLNHGSCVFVEQAEEQVTGTK